MNNDNRTLNNFMFSYFSASFDFLEMRSENWCWESWMPIHTKTKINKHLTHCVRTAGREMANTDCSVNWDWLQPPRITTKGRETHWTTRFPSTFEGTAQSMANLAISLHPTETHVTAQLDNSVLSSCMTKAISISLNKEINTGFICSLIVELDSIVTLLRQK